MTEVDARADPAERETWTQLDAKAITPAEPSPTSARPVGLGYDEPDHLMRLGEDETLCGAYVHGGAIVRQRYDGRRTCRECRQLAKEQGLRVEGRP